MTEYHWYYDESTGTLYYPDGTVATDVSPTDNPIRDSQVWALGIVDDVGLSNLSDEQMMWLLSMVMGLITMGSPPSQT